MSPPRTADLGRSLVALIVFAIVFTALEVGSYTRTSAVWDEPVHVTDGYVSLAQHDYRVDIGHPPFLRMWAALPLLALGVHPPDLSVIDRTPPRTWAWNPYTFSEQFLYVQNDADRLLYAARFMIVLLGVILGVFVFVWARDWLGFWPAVAALACYTIEPTIAAHAALVTTDAGLACFLFGAVYFLWRTCQQPRAGRVTGLVVCVALAAVSKYSAVILAPIVGLLLVWAVWRQKTMTLRTAAGIFALVGLCTWLAIWAIYGFRYAPGASGTWLYDFRGDLQVQTQVPALARVITWIDQRHLLPNAFSQGFLFTQSSTRVRLAFLNGAISDHGWWYYFPLAFLMKSPLAILLLFAVGVVVAVWRGRTLGLAALLAAGLPIVLFLGAAMMTRLNIGVRHILPIYPFVLLFVAVAARELFAWRPGWGAAVVTAVLAFGALEFGRNYPDNLAFFNDAVGGPANGAAHLVDSNLDWGQDLKGLKRWMDQNGVTHINLAYFGQAFPAYYHIDASMLPGSDNFGAGPEPQLPGYVAISETLLSGVDLGDRERAFYRSFHDRVPIAIIGHSIRIYWVDQQWW